MKINLEIEIDWISEGGQIDEEIRNEVIKGVTSKIGQNVKEQTESIVLSKTQGIVDKRVNEVFDEMLSSEVAITDNYGDVKATYKNVKEMIKERFDNFMTEMVDDSGRVSTYGAKHRRIEWICDVQISKLSKDFTNKTIDAVKEHVQASLNDSLKSKMGGEITKLLKVDKILNQINS